MDKFHDIAKGGIHHRTSILRHSVTVLIGAEGESRTHTGFPPAVFEFVGRDFTGCYVIAFGAVASVSNGGEVTANP